MFLFILQSLVQCHDGKIYLLKALPEKWKDGSLKGVKAIGGHTISIDWKDLKLTSIEIEFGFAEKAVLQLQNGKIITLEGKKGQKKTLTF